MRIRVMVVSVGLVMVAVWRPVPAVAVFSPLTAGVPQVAGTQPAGRPEVRRSRLVALNAATLPRPSTGEGLLARQPDLTLELFPDVFVVAAFDRFEVTRGGVTWVGRVRGDVRSSVTLVYDERLLTGSIITTAGTFAIRPATVPAGTVIPPGVGLAHEVLDIDQAALPREAEPMLASADAFVAADSRVLADSADVIDVLVVYTAAAEARAGGSQALAQLIALGAAETNTSYANAGIWQRIRVVHTAPVSYTEVNDFQQMLPLLRSGQGAGLSGVAALRDQYRADLVMLLVQPAQPNYCGVAYLLNQVSTASSGNGYSVVHTTCISPGLTFAHELGHNMGAHHDWYVTSSTLPYTYAHGYANPAPGHRWRTIMAYNDVCVAAGTSCRRLLNWSNPDLTTNPLCEPGGGFTCNLQLWYLPGAALGVPAGTRANCRTGDLADTRCDADNRRTLNNTALTVANFRPAVATATGGRSGSFW